MNFKYILFDPRSPRRLWRFFVYFYLLGILFFSVQPDVKETASPLWVQELKNWLHVPAYFGLTFLLLCGLGRITWRTRIAAVILASGYGLINEVAQMSVPGRYSSWADAARNFLGAALAVVLIHRNPILLTLKVLDRFRTKD